MALISNYNHHAGTTNMLVPFNNTSMILANRVYDVNFNMVSDEIVDLPSWPNVGLRSSQASTWVNKVKFKYPAAGTAFITYQTLMDVSTDNPVYGFSSMVDPYDPDYSYTFAGWYGEGANASRMFKLSKEGKIIASKPITLYSSYTLYDCAIIDINEKTLLVRGPAYQTSTYTGAGYWTQAYVYSYTYAVIDKNTLNVIKVLGNPLGTAANTESFEPFGSVIERTDSRIWIFAHNTNKPYYIDRADYTLGIKECPVKNSSVVTRQREYWNSYVRYYKGYATIPLTNITAEINGWHYYLNWEQTIDKNVLSFQAFKIDTENNTFETIDNTAMTVDISDECYNGAKPVVSLGSNNTATAAGAYDFYLLKKVADRDFIIIHGMSCVKDEAVHITRPAFKTRLLYVTVDQNDPSKLSIKTEKELEFNYEDVPLFMDNDKIGFVKHDIGIDVYRINTSTHTIDKFWEISTPDIGFATWFNGYLWWSNDVTNELHYETEDNIMTITASLDKSVYQLENTDDIQDATYTIYVTDNNGDKISTRVELVLNGPITFADGATTKIITTSATKETKETIRVTGAGKPRVSAKILS